MSLILLSLLLVVAQSLPVAAPLPKLFAGEIHYSRIPVEYW